MSLTNLPSSPQLDQLVASTIPNALGGAVAGDIVGWSDATTVFKSLNDTYAHATGILGVWDGARIRGDGEVATVNFTGTITEGAIAYLSGTAGLATCTAPSGQTVPRKIGRVLKALSASTAICRLSIDEGRDDNMLWTLHDEVLTGTATVVSYAVTRALWQELEIQALGVGAAGSEYYVEIPADHGVGWFSTGAGAFSGTSGAGTHSAYAWVGATTNIVSKQRKDSSTVWSYDTASVAFNDVKQDMHFSYQQKANPADTVVLDAGAGVVFRIGSRIIVRGRVYK